MGFADASERSGKYVYEDIDCATKDGLDCAPGAFPFDVDMENWRMDETKPQYAEYVQNARTVLKVGPIGYDGLSGVYFAPAKSERSPGEALSYYKRHLEGSVNERFPVRGTVDVRAIFGANFEKSTVACNPRWNAANPLAGNQEWCSNDGRYIPPHCASPTTTCREMYHYKPSWDQGHVEQLVKNHGLRYEVAYIQPRFAQTLESFVRASKPVLFYWYFPDPLTECLNAMRVTFPQSAMGSCQSSYVRDAKSPDGEITCDFRNQELWKVASTRVRKRAPRAYLVLQRLSMLSTDITAALSRHADGVCGGAGGAANTGVDSFGAACAWVRENPARVVLWRGRLRWPGCS